MIRVKKPSSYNKADRKRIASFYRGWEYDLNGIDLRFRGIKVMGLVRTIRGGKLKWKVSWAFLHRTVNKRRILNKNVGNAIRAYLSKGRFPLRVFMSSVEFFDPRRLEKRILGVPRILNSGIVSFENDENIGVSIKTALAVSDVLKDYEYVFVFTGNKSIHVWVLNFNWEEWAPKKYLVRNFYNAKIREVGEFLARKKFYDWVVDATGITNLDKSTATDTRRVIPVIGTLNALTWKRVVKIDRKELELGDPDYILRRATVALPQIGDGLPSWVG